MSGSLRRGSYSNAVLETLREKFSGRADMSIYDLRPLPLYDLALASPLMAAPGPQRAPVRARDRVIRVPPQAGPGQGMGGFVTRTLRV